MRTWERKKLFNGQEWPLVACSVPNVSELLLNTGLIPYLEK